MSGYKQNCSLCEECDSLSKFETNSFSEIILFKLCELLLIICIVMALHLVDILICVEFRLERIWKIKNKSKKLIQIISVSILILTLPVITILIAVALFYKVLCSVAIRRSDKRFVKFLDNFDVFCCLEDNATTNIQGIIKSNTIELAVDNIKEKLHNVFNNYSSDKIFYRRNEEYGFYYWRRYSFINLADYVQIAPDVVNTNVRLNSRIEIDQIVSYNDEGLFKVLIMKNNHFDNDGKDEYRIILKFHQSVKDAALVEFIARLVEKSDDCHVSISTADSQDYNSPKALMNRITKLCGILLNVFNDADRKNNKQDVSITNLKTLEWTKSDENLLCKVNDVRDHFNLANILGDTLGIMLRHLER